MWRGRVPDTPFSVGIAPDRRIPRRAPDIRLQAGDPVIQTDRPIGINPGGKTKAPVVCVSCFLLIGREMGETDILQVPLYDLEARCAGP